MKNRVCLLFILIIAIQACKKDEVIESAFDTALNEKAVYMNDTSAVLSDPNNILSFYSIGTVISSTNVAARAVTSNVIRPSLGVADPTRLTTVFTNGDPTIVNAIRANVTIASRNSYRLDFQADGNLVLYNGTTAIWNSQSVISYGSANQLASISFETSGNVICSTTGQLNYWTAYFLVNRPIWVMQDDGNFVGYSNYTLDINGNYTITGNAFAATSTRGGKKSNRNGRLN